MLRKPVSYLHLDHLARKKIARKWKTHYRDQTERVVDDVLKGKKIEYIEPSLGEQLVGGLFNILFNTNDDYANMMRREHQALMSKLIQLNQSRERRLKRHHAIFFWKDHQ